MMNIIDALKQLADIHQAHPGRNEQHATTCIAAATRIISLSDDKERLTVRVAQQQEDISELGSSLDHALLTIEQLKARNNLLDAANGEDSQMLQEILGLVKDIDERSRPVRCSGPG